MNVIHKFTKPGWRNLPVFILFTVILVLALYKSGSGLGANAPTASRLIVYAFSTQEEVMTQAIFPAFERKWEADTGKKLVVEGVFGPSGTIAGQINLGAPADVAIFSNERHVIWLKLGRRVQIATQPVVVGSTPIVIVTRPGNPFSIAEYADLTQPGLHLIHANPRTSGAGEWAVVAEYGSIFLVSADQPGAEQALKDIWSNVRWLAPSARAAMALFELGYGDAFITYEQDALLGLARGVPLEIVIPSRTIIAQHVAVSVDEDMTAAKRQAATAFLQFLVSETAQIDFKNYHLLSVTNYTEEFPPIRQPFTVEMLGGWQKVYRQLILSYWQEQIEPELELELLEGSGLFDEGE